MLFIEFFADVTQSGFACDLAGGFQLYSTVIVCYNDQRYAHDMCARSSVG